jgi:hypothetical protein
VVDVLPCGDAAKQTLPFAPLKAYPLDDPHSTHLELDALGAGCAVAAVQLLIVLLAASVHHAARRAAAGVEVPL